MEFYSSSAPETEKIGWDLAQNFTKREIVAFHGDLGAGKTTLIKGIVSNLSSEEKREIQSPTFTYLNVYNSNKKDYSIFHFDLYRLKNENDFIHMGFLDYLEGDGVVLLEWASRILTLLPKKTIHVHVTYEGIDKRKIDVHKG